MTTFATTPILVFDIETIADAAGARRIYPQLNGLNDSDTVAALTSLRLQEAGHDFMRLPLQRIVCISGLYINQQTDTFSLFSLTAEQLSEQEIIAKFFRAFSHEHTLPQLVSWNGSGFDIPVLIYRAMQYDLSVPLLFEEGNRIQKMRFDNYVNRFQTRHLDLMDRFSQYGASKREAMDVVASLYGLPGKTQVDGSMVGDLVNNNSWYDLAIYCESDVVNTWLIYLRWMRLNGTLSSNDFDKWQAQTHGYLTTLLSYEPTNQPQAEQDSQTESLANNKTRHHAFLQHWTAYNPKQPSL